MLVQMKEGVKNTWKHSQMQGLRIAVSADFKLPYHQTTSALRSIISLLSVHFKSGDKGCTMSSKYIIGVLDIVIETGQ